MSFRWMHPLARACAMDFLLLAARAALAQSSQPALRSLDPLPVPPVAPSRGDTVLSMPDAKPTDPIFRILGDSPEEPAGELVKETPPPPEIPIVQVLKNGDVLFGQNVGLKRKPADDPNTPLRSDPGWSSPIDFWYDAQNRKLHVRSLLITENGDAPDFGLRRSGDGTYPNGPPLRSKKSQNLGLIHWTGWSGTAGFDDWSAMIFCRAAEDITDHGAGGTLHLATTPVGSTGQPVDRLIVGSDGNVGIGAAAPAAALHVMQGRTAGLAEDYFSDEPLKVGDVVAIDTASAEMKVKRSTRAGEQGVVGVIAGNVAVRITEDRGDSSREHKHPDARQFPVAFAGRATVKVTAANGEIRPGDYLTSSATPGVAMKATRKGAVVGKALQPFSGEGVGNIQMLTNVTWYEP